MPQSAPLPCRYPGCSNVVESPGYCPLHRTQKHRDYGRARAYFDAEHGFYRSKAWRSLRESVLKERPLCRRCESLGLIVAATVVDHIQPIKTGGARFDWNNLQPLCVSCHNRKTSSEKCSRRQPPRGGEISMKQLQRCDR